MSRLGAGLSNLNNTCFFNAVLQSLTHLPQLVSTIQFHSCSSSSSCPLCLFKRHLEQAFSASRLEPHLLLNKMPMIFRKWRLGRQEDAHEFMRYLVDFLMRPTLAEAKVSLDTLRGSAVFQVLGGYLESTVLCLQCAHPSRTTEHFLDLALDLFECESVADCLRKFFKKERLSGSNPYFCEKCKQKVPASKYFRVKQLPQTLTLQLKRFSSNLSKIGKRIHTDFSLDLSGFCKEPPDSALYELTSVIVHQGRTCFSGHYYAYVNVDKQWHVMNDSWVGQVAASVVAKDLPYILVYSRVPARLPEDRHK
jgi:ubiquitin carboxyl-terminal hydrolase 36/42